MSQTFRNREARYWYVKGVQHHTGNGSPNNIVNYKVAMNSYKRAITLNPKHEKAHFKMGRLYEKGDGVEKNRSIAIHHYKLSAELGYQNAMYNVGILCIKGRGRERENELGMKWIELAARGGHKEATKLLTSILPDISLDKKTKGADVIAFKMLHELYGDDAYQMNIEKMYLRRTLVETTSTNTPYSPLMNSMDDSTFIASVTPKSPISSPKNATTKKKTPTKTPNSTQYMSMFSSSSSLGKIAPSSPFEKSTPKKFGNSNEKISPIAKDATFKMDPLDSIASYGSKKRKNKKKKSQLFIDTRPATSSPLTKGVAKFKTDEVQQLSPDSDVTPEDEDVRNELEKSQTQLEITQRLLHESVSDAKVENDLLQNHLSSTQKEIDSLRKVLKETKRHCRKYKGIAEDVTTENKELRKTLENYSNMMDKHKLELKNLSNENKNERLRIKEELEAARRRVEATGRAERRKLQQEMDERRKEMENRFAERHDELETERQLLSTDMDRLREELLGEHQQDTLQLHRERELLELQLEQMKVKLEQEREDMQTEHERLKSIAMQDAKSSKRQLMLDREALKKEMDALKDKTRLNEAHAQELRLLQKQVDVRDSHLAKLKQKMEKKKAILKEKEGLIQQTQKEIDQIKEDWMNKRLVSNEEHEKTKRLLAETKASLKVANQQAKEQKKKMDKLKMELESKQASLKEIEERFGNAMKLEDVLAREKMEKKKMLSQMSNLRNMVDQHERTISTQDQQLMELKKALEIERHRQLDASTYEKQLHTKDIIIEKLENRLEELSEEYQIAMKQNQALLEKSLSMQDQKHRVAKTALRHALDEKAKVNETILVSEKEELRTKIYREKRQIKQLQSTIHKLMADKEIAANKLVSFKSKTAKRFGVLQKEYYRHIRTLTEKLNEQLLLNGGSPKSPEALMSNSPLQFDM